MTSTDQLNLFDRMSRELYVAVVSDILDGLGFRDQVMEGTIRPIDPGSRSVLVGSAHTILMAPIYEMKPEPYTKVIAGIDSLQPGNVGVVATGGLSSAAYWGELFSNAALGRGARGMVMDGYHRDTRKILDLGFPVFSTGARPFDAAGRTQCIDFGVPVVCGGVKVFPGDIVFAEIDGIVVIPAAVAEECVAKAFEKVATEDRAREDLRDGALLSQVWEKYRVL
ncbi:MAG: RraA family protein [Thermomicrobiales bacterium]|nr:RraA family protein [Thermomicrobiales bacterium]